MTTEQNDTYTHGQVFGDILYSEVPDLNASGVETRALKQAALLNLEENEFLRGCQHAYTTQRATNEAQSYLQQHPDSDAEHFFLGDENHTVDTAAYQEGWNEVGRKHFHLPAPNQTPRHKKDEASSYLRLGKELDESAKGKHIYSMGHTFGRMLYRKHPQLRHATTHIISHYATCEAIVLGVLTNDETTLFRAGYLDGWMKTHEQASSEVDSFQHYTDAAITHLADGIEMIHSADSYLDPRSNQAKQLQEITTTIQELSAKLLTVQETYGEE